MKPVTCLLLIFLVATAAPAEPFPELPPFSEKFKQGDGLPDEGFENLAELTSWAAWTTVGGGWARKLHVADKDVFYSNRVFTSGHATSEVIFYTKGERTGRLRPFLIVPVQAKENRVTLESGNLVIRSYSRQSKSFELSLLITPVMIP